MSTFDNYDTIYIHKKAVQEKQLCQRFSEGTRYDRVKGQLKSVDSVFKGEARDWIHETRTRNKNDNPFREERLGEEGKGTESVNRSYI
jgi:hypothetical protein